MNKSLEKKHYKRLSVFNSSEVNSYIDDANCDVARQYQYVCK